MCHAPRAAMLVPCRKLLRRLPSSPPAVTSFTMLSSCLSLVCALSELNPNNPGVAQTLAGVLQKRVHSQKQLGEAAALFHKGARLTPASAETYYQLGKTHNMLRGFNGDGARKAGDSGTGGAVVGGRADETAAAWRTAIKLEPTMVEAYQMLALHLIRSPRKKIRKSAQSVAQRALKISPDSALGYYTYAQALGSQTRDAYKLKPTVRAKAADMYRVALSIGKSPDGPPGSALPQEREAETRHAIGYLLATTPPAARGSRGAVAEARVFFQQAASIQPDTAKYAESIKMLDEGIERFQAHEQARMAREHAKAQQELVEQEEAEWDADEEDTGFIDQRVY